MTRPRKTYSSFKSYGNKTYWLHHTYNTKRQAQTIAKGLKQLGWNARIEKTPDGWSIYRRRG